jgi:DNA primase
MIPDRTLQEIQERLDIVEVIGSYLTVKKAGRNFKALCPFHPEKTPSFMVYPQKQFFICYGCGAGGDLITFVMRHEQIDFLEAVRLLAEKAGVVVPATGGKGRTAPVDPDLYRAHEVAARFFHDLLMKGSAGEPARAYLKNRGVKPEVWEQFRLGYAPHRWDGLLEEARREGIPPPLMEKAGLMIAREGGEGWYDRFRNRVIFPIWDARGRVIAFGGRVLEEEAGAPKYMNSPETELYVKGRVLYGLHGAGPSIRERGFCIVVEGYMDLVALAQEGIRNVVASMGTSLTEHQVQLIRKQTRHVVMIYDGDYAGQMATLRGLDLFLEQEMRVKVVGLPGGLDPDSMIRSQGMAAMVQAIQQSQDLFDYKLGLLKRQLDPKTLEGRVGICAEMLPTIKRVPNAIQRGEYIKRLSELLRVEETLLWAELNRVKLDVTWRPALMQVSSPMAGAVAGVGVTAEELLAGLLLEEPARVARVADRLKVEDLVDPEVQKLVGWLIQQWRQDALPPDHRAVVNRLPRPSGHGENRLARWLACADTISEKDQVLEEVVARIHRERRRACLQNLQLSIRKAEEQRDEEATQRLILEYNRLIKV